MIVDDSRKILISCGRDKFIVIWDLNTHSILKIFQTKNSLDGGLVLLNNISDVLCPVDTPEIINYQILTADSDLKIRKWQLTIRGDFNSKDETVSPSLGSGGGITLKTMYEKAICLGIDSFNFDQGIVENILEIIRQTTATLVPKNLDYNSCSGRIVIANHQNDIFILDSQTFNNLGMFVGNVEEISDIKFFPLGLSSRLKNDHRRLNLENVPENEISELTIELDLLISQQPYIAFADNTPQPKISVLPTFKSTILYGHTENILALSTFPKRPNLLVSASKDNTAKIWQITPNDLAQINYKCIQTLIGHTNSVTAIVCSQNLDTEYLITASNDQTIKHWSLTFDKSSPKATTPPNKAIKNKAKEKDALLQNKQRKKSKINKVGSTSNEDGGQGELPSLQMATGVENDQIPVEDQLGDDEIIKISDCFCKYTVKAHDKDINCVTLSPKSAKYFATGSMDKTAKLWNTSDGYLLGVFRGHKRGIWDLKFSSIHQILATCSGDTTIKLWALSDFTCIQTLEGSTCAVLHLEFINNSAQLITSSSDGLIKLWTLENENCVTFDAHEGKIWSFTLDAAENCMITGGGSDGRIVLWKDVSGEEKKKSDHIKETQVLSQQTISNLLKQKIYDHRIFKLTIEIEDSSSLLIALNDMLTEERAQISLENTLKKLELSEIDTLLRFAARWNTNSKNCFAAQCVINTIFHNFHPDLLLKLPNINSSIQALIPYTDKHYDRLTKLYQDSTYVEYLRSCLTLEEPLLHS